MTESRSGLSSSASARATASMTVAGRNAPASSWAGVVRRASNSGAGRGVAGLEGGLGMILANVRGRLRVQDFLLVALALAHGDTARRARYERQLLEEGPDELLDEPGLLAALLALRTLMVPSPALFTYVAVRHTLRAAGVDDRALADYLAALLLEFGDHDRQDRKSTRLNSSHDQISYAVFCLKKKKKQSHSAAVRRRLPLNRDRARPGPALHGCRGRRADRVGHRQCAARPYARVTTCSIFAVW